MREYRSDYTIQEIAEFLKLSESTVRRRLENFYFRNGEFIRKPENVEKHKAALLKKYHKTSIDDCIVTNKDMGLPSICTTGKHIEWYIVNNAWKQQKCGKLFKQ